MNWRELYLEWLEEWLQLARDKGSADQVQWRWRRAINSLRAADIEVTSPEDLQPVPNIGAKTIQMLTDRTRKYCSENDIELPASLSTQHTRGHGNLNTQSGLAGQGQQAEGAEPAARRPSRTYVPRPDSVGYHALLCLRRVEKESSEALGLGRQELQRLVQPRLAESAKGSAGANVPAALATLAKHEYVYMRNSRYFLDEEGRRVADRLLGIEAQRRGAAVFLAPQAAASLAAAARRARDYRALIPNTFREEVWPPGDYELRLILDNREIADRHNRSGLIDNLAATGVNVDQQSLSIGDVLWVAQHKRTNRRAVLDFVVERKTLADLKMSIHDGRFQEQKARLVRSTLQHVVYLVEFEQTASNRALFRDNRQKLQTSMSQTLILNRFYLKETGGQLDTVRYLSAMMRYLELAYAEAHLHVVVPNVETFGESMRLARVSTSNRVAIDYDSFHEGMAKSKLRSVGEVFRTMLTTIKGITPEKAMVIQQIYKTPMRLFDAYQQLPQSQRSSMISDATRDQITRRKIRPEQSDMIYQVWGAVQVPSS